jgi:nucleotide-binding universal stress UspA family protein
MEEAIMTQKILIALDDSENALRAVEYVAKNLSPVNEVTLFSALQDTAALCAMSSPELTDYFVAQQSQFCALEDAKRKLVEETQQKARDSLIAAGFNEANIQTKVEVRNQGIARDIVQEAKNGYDLIVMGRRGLSGIKEFFFGSVSQKVIHGAKDISILIVN